MSSFDLWPPVTIAGTGSFVPEREVTNADLIAGVDGAPGLDTTDDWIVTHTGIRARRWVRAGVNAENDGSNTSAYLATQAAQNAMQAAEVAADEIDLLVLATSTPDWAQPATASAVHAQLGLRPDCGVFDLNAVCSGFVYALQAGASMLAGAEAWNHVLVVGAECYSRFTDPADRSTRIFFGDGAGAVVLRKQFEVADIAAMAAAEAGIDIGSELLAGLDGGALDDDTCGVRSVAYAVDHSGKDALLTEHNEYFQMDGPAVREYAIPALVAAVQNACRDAGVSPSDLKLLIPHQSNLRMLEAAIDQLNLPEAKLAVTVDRYGNTAGASIPLTLDEMVQAGRIMSGDLICLAGYGSGLQSAACVIRWE